jgi:hypothetical protein
MMSEERKKIIKSFQFRTHEGEDLYKSVLVVCDLALQIEMSKVMSPEHSRGGTNPLRR